jgi:hypothetical protein
MWEPIPAGGLRPERISRTRMTALCHYDSPSDLDMVRVRQNICVRAYPWHAGHRPLRWQHRLLRGWAGYFGFSQLHELDSIAPAASNA